MKVFVTGATGFIGSAVAAAFARAGHETFGLVHTPEKAGLLDAAEVVPVRLDPELRAAVEARDRRSDHDQRVIREALRRFLDVA